MKRSNYSCKHITNICTYMIEKWKENKEWLFMTMLFFYWLQRITDIKWLYHVLLPICLFFAYFTCRVLYAEWKTEDSMKNVVLHILKKNKWDVFCVIAMVQFTIAYLSGILFE